MDERTWLALALGLAFSLGLLRLAAWVRSMRARQRLARARTGERDARRLLVRSGFDVVAEQARGEIVLTVDGSPSRHALRADYLVVRRGQRFVAEVKTGRLAPSLEHAPTRRQILEYCAAFDVDGALLVDPEAGSVREIALAPRPRWPLAWIGLAIAWTALVLVLTR